MLSHNPIVHARTKHIELDIHFIREIVVANKFQIQHVSAQVQITDILTKSLSTNLFVHFRDKLMISSSKSSWVWGGVLNNS